VQELIDCKSGLEVRTTSGGREPVRMPALRREKKEQRDKPAATQRKERWPPKGGRYEIQMQIEMFGCEGLGVGGHTALEGEEDQVGAAADTEFIEEIGDVEFYGALGDIELAGDFLIGKIFEERIENFLLAAAEIGDRIGFEAARLAGKDGVNKAGKNGAGNPETAGSDERKSADELVAGFGVSENAFYAEAEERKAVGVVMGFSDDDEAGVRMAFENIGEQRAGGLAGGVGVDDINLSFGRFEGAQIGSESGLELLGDNFEIGLGQNAFELAQHQGVRREEANRELRRG
jgi:hypothetical protein